MRLPSFSLGPRVRAVGRAQVRSHERTQVGPRAPRSGAGAGPEYDYG
jgi:hypothetical protein